MTLVDHVSQRRICRSIDVEGGPVWSYIEKILRRQKRVRRRADRERASREWREHRHARQPSVGSLRANDPNCDRRDSRPGVLRLHGKLVPTRRRVDRQAPFPDRLRKRVRSLSRTVFRPSWAKDVTLLFGVHLEMGLFVGVDPRMHSPTWFPRSVEFRTSDSEAARAQGWHGWERERSDARNKVRPEESLLTETVIAFRPDQFLRYVEFERLASGLDCGERCLLSDRIEQSLSGGPLLTAPVRHPLEIHLGIPASDILDVAMGRIGRA